MNSPMQSKFQYDSQVSLSITGLVWSWPNQVLYLKPKNLHTLGREAFILLIQKAVLSKLVVLVCSRTTEDINMA